MDSNDKNKSGKKFQQRDGVSRRTWELQRRVKIKNCRVFITWFEPDIVGVGYLSEKRH